MEWFEWNGWNRLQENAPWREYFLPRVLIIEGSIIVSHRASFELIEKTAWGLSILCIEFCRCLKLIHFLSFYCFSDNTEENESWLLIREVRSTYALAVRISPWDVFFNWSFFNEGAFLKSSRKELSFSKSENVHWRTFTGNAKLMKLGIPNAISRHQTLSCSQISANK